MILRWVLQGHCSPLVYLQVTRMHPTQFSVNWLFGLREVENRYARWYPLKTICIKYQIHFLGNIRKIFQNVICWKYYPECKALRHYNLRINPFHAKHDIPCLSKQCDPDQLASEEANWSGSALFAIKYVNLYQQTVSSNLIGWKLEMGVAS